MNKAASVSRIAVTISEGVASVQIDNPSQRNALTRAMCLELQDLMPRLDANPDVVLVTLRGAGDSFSAGAQIHDLVSVLLDPQPDGSRIDHLSRADDAITAVAKPVIALVDGACMGGGWQIASACDFILASERSVFAITPAKLGVIYPRIGIERLVRLVGPDRAKYILFTAQKFSAARAEALGLVAEAIPDSEFENRVQSLLGSLKKRSRFSMHTLKHLVDATAADVADIEAEWKAAWDATLDAPDLAIGVAAFLAREQPAFRWTPGNS